jgi:hypothetical protein
MRRRRSEAFCRLFGPEHAIENLGEFLSYLRAAR